MILLVSSLYRRLLGAALTNWRDSEVSKTHFRRMAGARVQVSIGADASAGGTCVCVCVDMYVCGWVIETVACFE